MKTKEMQIVIILLLVVILVIQIFIMTSSSSSSGTKLKDSSVYIGIASLLVSIVSISVMVSQGKIIKSQLFSQKMEHQPSYVISFQYKYDDKGCVFATEYSISNVGEKTFGKSNVEERTYIRIEFINGPTEIIYAYVPLNYYFNVAVVSGNLTGEIVHSVGAEYLSNHKKYHQLYYDALHYTRDEQQIIVLTDLVHVFEIDYTDIYGEDHTIFYKNTDITSEEEVINIKKNASYFFGYQLYGLDGLDLEQILSIMEGKNTKEE